MWIPYLGTSGRSPRRSCPSCHRACPETLNALFSVTDDLLMAVLSQSITYMHDAADGDEREAALVEELDEKLDTHYSEMPDDAIDKMVGNEKFVEMR